MSRIAVVGSSNIDLTFRVPRLPRSGETLPGTDFQIGFGGKGANQAVTAARLGAEVVFVSCVGDDIFGEQLRDHYRREGMDPTHIRVVRETPTGTAGILVDARAANCIVVVPGANAALGVQDIEQAAEAIRSSAVLLCQLETPPEATLLAFRLARAAGVRTIFNPAPAREVPQQLWDLVDVLAPNETEAELLTGSSVESIEQAEQAAGSLLARGPAAVVLTRGDQGGLVVDASGCRTWAAVPVKAVDPTAAGDAFLGALAVYLAEGQDLDSALQRASEVAALSVTRAGAQASLPTRAEVDAFAGHRNADGHSPSQG
jgi:ribokinase